MTKTENIIESLKASGFVECSEYRYRYPRAKRRKFVLSNFVLWVGSRASVRSGKTASKSKALSERFISRLAAGEKLVKLTCHECQRDSFEWRASVQMSARYYCRSCR